jgi:hypothetical protein
MSKKLVIGMVVALVIVLAVAGSVFAQGSQPPGWGSMGQPSQPGQETPGGQPGRGPRPNGGRGVLVDVTAQLTGLERDEVIAELREGQTFGQIVEAQGKTVQDLIDAFVADREAELEQAVAEGCLTSEVAEAMSTVMRARVEAQLGDPEQQAGTTCTMRGPRAQPGQGGRQPGRGRGQDNVGDWGGAWN